MKSYDINLLPKKKNKVADRLLHFILYYFRYIIVITQIIVIGVFFFRFRVDQGVIDLKEAFKQKQQILAVTIPIVEEARLIEAKTDKVREIIDEQDLFLARMDFLLSSIPQDIRLRQLQIDPAEIIVSGSAQNVFSIRALHRKISITEGFELAEIQSIDTSAGETNFEFSIRIPLDNGDE